MSKDLRFSTDDQNVPPEECTPRPLTRAVNDPISTHISFNDRHINKIKSIATKRVVDHLQQKIELNKMLFHTYVYIEIISTEMYKIISSYLNKEFDPIFMAESVYVAENKKAVVAFRFSHGTLLSPENNMGCEIYCRNVEDCKETIENIKELLKPLQTSDVNHIIVDWFYNIPGKGMNSITISDEISDCFLEEAYPYIDVENVAKLYNESNEPILVLLGPPGTGKTRLIRYILNNICKIKGRDVKVMFSSDQEIIESGQLFPAFLESNRDFMVLEDIDYHLRSRKDGNTSMYNFLSISNGLIINFQKQKKIILSTNLPNINNIDSALLRPGRCFSIINTRELYYDEAICLLKKLGINQKLIPERSYSLAELYNINNEKPAYKKKTPAGFI